ncbi:MAG TPA: hypothetical protein VJC39_01605, partial [Candidatus Nanoarchaeia archaeon]|nr:hypothetical protein [Candidatus Nanoarchaeia archaeon]
EGYWFADLEKVIWEDNTNTDQDEFFLSTDYIFKLEQVDLSNPKKPILNGIAADYDMSTNIVLPNYKKMTLNLGNVAEYLTFGEIVGL